MGTGEGESESSMQEGEDKYMKRKFLKAEDVITCSTREE